jgi:large subunit ribosomal protein L22
MQVRAIARRVRLSPRKAQRVVEIIRGRPASEALAILRFTPNAAARAIWKVVRSAMANAENNYGLDPDALYVVSATANQGPSLPRMYRPKARGQAGIVKRRTTHLTVVVDDEPGLEQRRRRRPGARRLARPAGTASGARRD